MGGFFSSAELQLVKQPQITVPRCGSCGLDKLCNSPKIKTIGRGKRKVLIVGEAPGKDEDNEGAPFVGISGQYLRNALVEIGIDPEGDCWITNAVICRPHTDKDKNRTPTDKEVQYCRPNLFNDIARLQPNVVIVLGAVAVQSLIGGIWKEEASEAIGKWVGWQIPNHKPNMWICPSWHPSYLLRSNGDPVLARCFKQHLENAFTLKEKPWKESPPDYKKKVKVVVEPEKAAEIIYEIIRKKPKLAAFDYETTTLKPDGPKSEIDCCSISDGEITVAYPWYGPTIKATEEFLFDKEIGKIAANMKFESRWTMKQFGKKIRNLVWDTMIAAHVLDNRSGICGLKFQSYVLLGQPSYDDHISPFLRSVKQGCNEVNRVKEIGLKQRLLYCGLDSLLEITIARIQMKKMGISYE
ncbi:hypothetical protein C4577_04215 [Candidatus Parcubacteria bacterium]|nr:MAG: hypothetical protein C4577_04215 [Candidatus Parcubacteria bacterium]